MSWRNREDLGTTLVGQIHDQLRVADAWTIDCGRGFVYWPSDYALTVTSDLGNFHNAYSIFRLHAETDLVTGSGKSREMMEPFAQMMCNAALSAVTYDPEKDLYKLHCSVYAHTDNAEWLARAFSAAIGLQIAMAPRLARHLEKTYGLTPAVTPHPQQGMRTQPDPLVNAIEQFFLPYGKSESKWLGSNEWKAAEDNIYRLSIDSRTDEQGELTAEFDWLKDQPIRLLATARKPHAHYGHGLYFSLMVPWAEDPLARARAAHELNELERREWNWCHDLGSWCSAEEGLAFHCFVPNISFAPGCLPDMAHDMALRAKWVNEHAGMASLGVSGA
jgi:hypothetical protein